MAAIVDDLETGSRHRRSIRRTMPSSPVDTARAGAELVAG
jgi:hypothetical protein